MNENNMNTPTNNEAPAYAQQPAPQAPVYTQAPVYAAPQPVAQAPTIFRIFGLISFILGFVNLVFAFVPGANYAFAVFSVVGIVFGILGMRHPAMKGKAIAGMICNIVALVLSIIMIAVYLETLFYVSSYYYYF